MHMLYSLLLDEVVVDAAAAATKLLSRRRRPSFCSPSLSFEAGPIFWAAFHRRNRRHRRWKEGETSSNGVWRREARSGGAMVVDGGPLDAPGEGERESDDSSLHRGSGKIETRVVIADPLSRLDITDQLMMAPWP